MVADFFTNPLQGELYRFFRNIVMGYVSIVDVISGLVENKERVGKCDNISRTKKYEQMIFSKYPRKESTDTKNDDTKDRTY